MREILTAPFASLSRLSRQTLLLLVLSLIFFVSGLAYLYWPIPKPDLKLIEHSTLEGENCVVLQVTNQTEYEFAIFRIHSSPMILSRVQTPDGWEAKAMPVLWKKDASPWPRPASQSLDHPIGNPCGTIMRPGDSTRIAIPYPRRNGAATHSPFKIGIKILRFPSGMIEDLKIRLSRRVNWAPAEPTEVYLWSDPITPSAFILPAAIRNQR